ncbi:MAG: 30S ribosomal protein S20 [Acholeplasmatales bacterium]|nr:30S ribosomal protein S20 [Acholeplasmatales bacterium]
MANIKQQIKRIRTNEKARQNNQAFKSSLKTAIKAVYTAVDNKDKEAAVSALNVAYKKLDKAQAKHIVHKNYVARHKSELASKVNELN